MSELQEIERDIREYIEKEPNLRREDRLSYLISIFNKRLELTKLDYVVNHHDYINILNQAKNFYIKMRLPVRLSRKELLASEAVHIAMLETFISYLNKNNILKKLVKFDFTE